MPKWIHFLSAGSLLLGVSCAVYIAWDVARRPQRMAIMNLVWPVTALFGTVLTLRAYLKYGRRTRRQHEDRSHRATSRQGHDIPFRVIVGKGALHCGAGCMLGDLLAEWLAFLFPILAVWFGWHTLFADRMYSVWVLDFVFAFAIGIVFQYFAIVPMRGLSPGAGILAALKADTLSLLSWQIGMYGFMAFAQLYVFDHLLGHRAGVDSLEFWFAMQIAMIAGFVTAYPVNWWLITSGIKEKM